MSQQEEESDPHVFPCRVERDIQELRQKVSEGEDHTRTPSPPAHDPPQELSFSDDRYPSDP